MKRIRSRHLLVLFLLLTAYEMYKNRWTREQAMAHVRAARPQIDPNEEFLEQLED